MEDKNQIKMPTRLQLINKLMVQFNKDYEGMLKKYSHSQNIELTEHLLQQLKHIEEYQKTKKEDWYSEEMFVRFIPIASFGTLKGIDPLKRKPYLANN